MIRNYVKKYEAWVDLDPDNIELEPNTRKPSKKVLDQLTDDILNCNIQGVKDYIACDYDVNAKDEIGNTPLINASRVTNKKALEIFKLLLNSGANVNDISDKTKNTALIGVCGNRWCTTDIIETLISLGADVNAKNIGGYTPLLRACEGNDDDIVELLLKHGADTNIISKDGDTPLCYACMNRNKEIIEMLLAHNADLNFKLKNNRTFIEDAIIRYDIDIIRQLIKASNSKINYDEILKLIHEIRYVFSRWEDFELMKDLIEDGAMPTMKMISDIISYYINDEYLEFAKKIIKRDNLDVNKITNDTYNETILTELLDSEDITDELVDFILFLLKEGADINHKGINDYSALRKAVNNNNEELVEFLLKNGADANTRDRYQETPLIASDNIDICQLLLDYGADINAQDIHGDTALHCATSCYANPNGNYELVKFLLEAGADTSITNKEGMTPPDLAKNWNIEQLYFGDDYDDEEDYDDDEDYDNEEY